MEFCEVLASTTSVNLTREPLLLTLSEDPGQLILDFAYSSLRADNVQTVVPEEDALSIDTIQHQVFVSVIKHF